MKNKSNFFFLRLFYLIFILKKNFCNNVFFFFFFFVGKSHRKGIPHKSPSQSDDPVFLPNTQYFQFDNIEENQKKHEKSSNRGLQLKYGSPLHKQLQHLSNNYDSSEKVLELSNTEHDAQNSNINKNEHCANPGCRSNGRLCRKGWIEPGQTEPVMLCNACGLRFAKRMFCPLCKYIYTKSELDRQAEEWSKCNICNMAHHISCVRKELGSSDLTSYDERNPTNENFLCPSCFANNRSIV
eukprot:gb/GECH01001446.1/.p1 GENE.gb/GECH01001446.1/~~gb/GECH01001446.1/.p1  ORF type:complete len:240 (+),score=31.79 gb/GECH01001446.1/:1-720(+)